MYHYRATITKVYDGDTLTATVDLGFYAHLCNIKLRLSGINTPEVRGSERAEGLRIRDFVRELVLNKEVEVKTIKDSKGKYGRWLAVVILPDGRVLNQLLVEEGMAKEVAY